MHIDIRDLKQINKSYKIKIFNLYTNTYRVFIFKRLEDHIEIYDKNNNFTGEVIHIGKQKTGYGIRSFFNCPNCGNRRNYLYYDFKSDRFLCRSCINQNIYKARTNIYDEGGTQLIDYKMTKLADKVNIELKYPFKYNDYLDKKPYHMRTQTFNCILKQLILLDQLRYNVIFFRSRYSAAQINSYLKFAKICNTFEEVESFNKMLVGRSYIPVKR